MSYTEKINESKQKVYEKAIATKILTLMDKLRLSSNENNKRRWIWELLQNAKDVKSREREGVNIIVDLKLDEKVLVFKHNGRHFFTENITFLIEQVSTKERSDESLEEISGQFGTGFLTTHLLSEIVEVRGVVQDDELPYRKFCITLDRSGADIPTVIASVNKSLDQLNQLEQSEDYKSYDENEFNTSFTYHLNQDGIEVAIAGIQDLEVSLPLNLVFQPSILSVRIQDQNSTYKIASNKKLPGEMNDFTLNLFRVSKNSGSNSKIDEFITIKDASCEIAVPIIQQGSTILLKKRLQDIKPRIFCSFPLIGSEKFGTPFFINSPYFQPTEPRDGVFLTDKVTDKVELNKKIIRRSVYFYSKLIDYASSQGWENLYELAKISIPPQTDWLSIDWYKENVLRPIQEKIYTTPLVKIEDGTRTALQSNDHISIHVPFDSRKEIRDAIWDLAKDINWLQLPAKAITHEWYAIFKNSIWNREHCLTIHRLSQYIGENSSELEDLSIDFGIESPLDWLNQYFSVLQLSQENPIDFLQGGNYKLIPNQYGELCLPDDLANDLDIEEPLKDISEQLFRDYRKILAHKSVLVSIRELLSEKSQETIVHEMNKALQSNKVDLGKKKLACHALTRLFPSEDSELIEKRNLIYDVSKKIFSVETLDKHYLVKWSPEIWEISDRFQTAFIVHEISQLKNLHALSSHLCEDISDVRGWLSSFVNLLIELEWKDLLGEKTPILPNQNGTFCDLNSLFCEGETIDESLKDISAYLRRDVRDELLDITFDVPIPQNRRVFQKDLGSEIRNLVTPLLSELPRKETTQDIFDELILWMDSHPDVAKDIFGDLFENRHKLYDDAEVAKNLRQVRELMLQVEDLSQKNSSLQAENDELKAQVENLRAQISDKQSDEQITKTVKVEIDDAFLLTYGVTTEEQLKAILLDPAISQKYVYYEQGDYDPFSRLVYVLKIIERAKQNVRRYLESLDDYDCSNWHELGKTFVSGILKRGKPIEIIVRPSDSKKIIFYYPEEKKILSLMNSELWVEDGETLPQQITLGMVLQFQDINRIDLP